MKTRSDMKKTDSTYSKTKHTVFHLATKGGSLTTGLLDTEKNGSKWLMIYLAITQLLDFM